ncbi:MAG: SDR family NAD(P)-dependent oxidoreductase [Myxococcota bacterium]
MNVKGQWIWITGASSGLGLELAKKLAKQGANLVITARRADRLEALARELSAGGVEVRPIPGDMSRGDDVERLLAQVKKLPLAVVVLNAGVTHFGPHHEMEWPAFEAMLHTNVISTTRVTTELVKHFQATGAAARIMLVTSMAGLMPVPFQAAYSGTKAFLTAFGTALAHELSGSPITVTVFAPGGIATEMTAGERFGSLRGWLAPVEDVADEALDALRARPPLYVQGFVNRFGLFMFRFLPRNLVMGQLGRQYRKALQDAAARQSPKS